MTKKFKKMLDEGIELLQQFQKFKKKRPKSNLAEFGQYLINQEKTEKTDLTSLSKKMPFQFPAKSVDEYIGWLWGRLIHFTQIWEKKAFANEAIQNLTEFGVIMFVLTHDNCSKTDISNSSLQEKTTIFETIKRMVKKGLLLEKESELDKRSKLITLSEQGKFAAFRIMDKVNEVSQHLVADLGEDDKLSLFEMLARLDHYHKDCFEKYKSADWDTVKNEMLN